MTKLDFQEGDVVRPKPGTVTAIVPFADDKCLIYVKTVDRVGSSIAYYSDELEMVKRAVRRPKAGDVITAQEVYDTKWKRGTLLCNEAGDLLALNADARWVGLDEGYPRCGFSFDEVLDDNGTFKVVFLP